VSKLFKKAALRPDIIVTYAYEFAKEYDREYGSAGFAKSFYPENQLTRILIDKALNTIPNCSKGDAYEIAISAEKILETMGINPVAAKTGSVIEPGLLYQSPGDSSEKYHDYNPNWDYEIDETPDPTMAATVKSICGRIFAKTNVPFQVWAAKLGNDVGTYINGTTGYPVILIDLENHRGSEDQFGKTISHELKHHEQEDAGRDFDEDEAENESEHEASKTGAKSGFRDWMGKTPTTGMGNSRDLTVTKFQNKEGVQPEPFMDKYTIVKGFSKHNRGFQGTCDEVKSGFYTVFDGDKPIASMCQGSLVVDKKYRRQGIGLELAKSFMHDYPDYRPTSVTPKSKKLFEKAWDGKTGAIKTASKNKAFLLTDGFFVGGDEHERLVERMGLVGGAIDDEEYETACSDAVNNLVERGAIRLCDVETSRPVAAQLVKPPSDAQRRALGKLIKEQGGIVYDIRKGDYGGAMTDGEARTAGEFWRVVNQVFGIKTADAHSDYAKTFPDDEAFLKHHYTGFIPSRAYENKDWTMWKKEDFPVLFKTFTLKNGEQVELRKTGRPNKYVKTDENQDIIRDPATGLATYLSSEEMKAQNLHEFDTAIFAFDMAGNCVGQANDEWGADGVWVAPQIQRQGLGVELLTELKKQYKPERQMGQMTNEGIGLAKKYYQKLKSSTVESPFKQSLLQLRPQMAAAAQKVYDEWVPNDEGEDDTFGGGGICDQISEAIQGVIVSNMEADIAEGGQDGDDHAWTIAYSQTETYSVDIHPYVYERGGGYSWTKVPGVRFDADDVEIFPVDVSAEDLNKYSSCIECNQKISKKASADGTVLSCGCGKNEFKTADLTYNTPRQPLDFDTLYGKAFKIVDNAGDHNIEGFSIVTPENGDAWNWRERPEFKSLVKQKLNDPDFLADHKYNQILNCAKTACSAAQDEADIKQMKMDAAATETGTPEQKAREQFGVYSAGEDAPNPLFIWTDGMVTSGTDYHEQIACYVYDEDPKAVGVSMVDKFLRETGAVRISANLTDDFNVQIMKSPTRRQIRSIAILSKGMTLFWDIGDQIPVGGRIDMKGVTSGRGTFGEFQRTVDKKFGKIASRKVALDAVLEELNKPISAEDPQRDIGGQGTGEESPANSMATEIDEPDKQYNHPFGLGMGTEPESARYASILRKEIAAIEKRASLWTAADVEQLQALRMELHLFAKTAAEMPKYLFHGTKGDNVPSILKGGLRANCYLSTEPVAAWYAAWDGNKNNAVVIRIPISNLDTSDLVKVKRLMPGSLAQVGDTRIWQYAQPIPVSEDDVFPLRVIKTAERGQLKFHDQPDKLPPRDDMKSHIDKTQLDPQLKKDKKERKNPATVPTPVPLPPQAKIEGTPPTSAAPLKQDLAYRSRFAASDSEITIYRGEGGTSKKSGPYWSPDKDFARQFTHSGLESELKKNTIQASDVYTPNQPVYGGDPDAIDFAVAEARGKGFKAVRLSEGQGEPDSIYVFERSALRNRSRFGAPKNAAATFEGNAWITPEGGIFGEGDEHGAALDPSLDPDDEDQAGMEARRAKAIREAFDKGWVRANNIVGNELNVEMAHPMTEQQRAVLAATGRGKVVYYDFRGHPEAFGLVHGRGPSSFGQLLRDHDAFFKLSGKTAASDPDQYWEELVNDQEDKAKTEFMSHPDIKQIALDNGWTMEEAWENVGRDFTSEFHNPANRFFA
jgi:GNAT superfamily N-acetyltransferase